MTATNRGADRRRGNDGPRFTRRHWARELLGLVGSPLTMFMSKSRSLRRPIWSMERVILGVFVFRFAQTFPTQWSWEAVAALAILTFALVVEALFAMVPAREGLAALTTVFQGIVARKLDQTTTTTATTTEETTVTAVDPTAVRRGPEGQEGP